MHKLSHISLHEKLGTAKCYSYLEYCLIPSPLFGELGILKIKDVFVLQISKFIHKCVNSNIIGNFDKWFILNFEVHSHRTRSNYNYAKMNYTNNLFIPFGRTTTMDLN